MDGPARQGGAYTFGKYRLDPIRRTLTRGSAPVKLTARLFDTLLYLVEHRARVVARHELALAVWGTRQVDDANVAMAVSSLRKALQGDEADQKLISTVPGKGFQFVAAVDFVSAPAQPETAEPGAVPASVRRAAAWRFASLANRRGAGAAALVICAACAALFWRLAPVAIHGDARPAFLPPPRSIAVLAFRNESGDAAQEYFSDGISEELINALSQVGGLHVAARSSAFSFKRKPASDTDIARRLNVGAVLSGSVGRHGTRLSIDARLTDGVTGAQVWSHHFVRAAGETLQTQVALAQAVTATLRVRLVGSEVAGLTLGGTANPLAFDAYLRAVAARRASKSESDDKRTIALFNEAVALDPGFAIAQAQRAMMLWSIAAQTGSSDRAYVLGLKEQSLAGARRAVALAPDLAIAHVALGYALGATLPNFGRQEAELARARDLAPGDATVLREFSRFEAFAGHFARAVDAAEQAVALDPLTPGSYSRLAWTLLFARRPGDAVVALQHAFELGLADDPSIKSLRGQIALLRGDAEGAARACSDDRAWPENVCLAIAYHALGKQKEALAQVAKLDALGAEWGPFAYAVIYAQWGRLDEALAWLEKAYDLPDQGIIQIEASPWLDPIRQDPRFKDIERRLNVPAR